MIPRRNEEPMQACLHRPRLAGLLAATLIGAADAPPAHAAGVTWEPRLEVASGGGYRGPWRMNESEYDYVDDPTVAIDDRGVIAVSWVDQARKDVVLQVFEADGRRRLEAPVNVSRSPRVLSWLPRMAIGPRAERIYVLWQEIVFSGGSLVGEILFARSRDGGRSFDPPVNLSDSMAGDGKGRLTERYWDNGSLDLVMGPAGVLYAAWTEYDGALWFSRSTDAGASFSDPLHVAGDDRRPARGPALAAGADAAIHLVWTVGEERSADVRIARSDDGGRSFGEPRIVLPSDGHSDAPKVVADGSNDLHVVYGESPAGPFERYRISYARLAAGKRTFEGPMTIARPREGETQSVHFPSLARDGADRLYVVWNRFPRVRRRPFGLGFAFSADRGRTFSEPMVVPGSLDPSLGFNGSQQGLLMRKLAVNERGRIALVNSTFRPNEGSGVWLFRGRLDESAAP